MISAIGVYHVIEAIVPLYVAMILGYVSVRWWKIFSPEECTGINRLVSKFSVPLLSFGVISTNNPYRMNLKLIFSDTLQKIFALILLALFSKLTYRRRTSNSLDCIITGFSLTTLPNTLIVGVPVLKAMYGDGAAAVLAQIVVLQSLIWYNILLFLFEFRAVRAMSSVNTTPLETPKTGQSNVEDEAKDGTPRMSSSSSESGEELEEITQQTDEPNIDEPNIGEEVASETPIVIITPEIVDELEITRSPDLSNARKEAKDGVRRVNTKRVNTKHILLKVGRKLIINPNTHATFIGLIWSLISFRWELKLPTIVEKSISILADGGLGMAMFSIGIFMASQASILACKTWLAFLSLVARFLLGPGLMAVASFAFGLRRTLFKIAIVQAALPQGIAPFVFAKEYNVQPDILSTAIMLGMVITIPATLAYYFLLEL